jgi:hypothetical protein
MMMNLLRARKIGFLIGLLIFIPCVVADGSYEEPTKVTVCQLKNDPAAYNHKLVQVTGFISRGFEDFTLFDPTCSSWDHIWLEYGGTAVSGTMYCCGVTNARTRPKKLVIEKISIPLVDDPRFREFDGLIQRKSDLKLHATIVGRFFSGKQIQNPGGVSWGGYGHMGCCSLLAIQQVVSVDPQDSDDLDYGASPDQPDIDKIGCGYSDLLPTWSYGDWVKAQQNAEADQSEWVFNDPQRVASDTLAKLLKIDEKSITEMIQTRKAQGRFVYQWRPKAKQASYMVVVSRPYLLSFYTKDAKKVAWVPIAAYESSCGGGSSVIRIR